MIRTLVDAKAIYEKAAGTSAANHFENGWLAALHVKPESVKAPDVAEAGRQDQQKDSAVRASSAGGEEK